MALAPLERAFGIDAAVVATLQALSGAGYPGVASLDVADNVIPYIGGGEEEKIESEPLKILGTLRGRPLRAGGVRALGGGPSRGRDRRAHQAVFVRLRAARRPARRGRGAGRASAASRRSGACPARPSGRSTCSRKPTAPSPAWTATASAAWRYRWDASARTPCSA